MATQQVPLTTPIKGVVRAVNREGQPPETCWDAQNVLPYDRYGRKRLAQRGGLLKQYPNQMSANFVQAMIEAPNIIYPPQALTIPVYSVIDLPGWGPFTTPGTVGPFLYNGSTFSFNLEWQWTFTVSYSQTVNAPLDVSIPWATSTESATAVFYFPLGEGATDNLILLVGAAGEMNDYADFGPPPVDPSSAISAVMKYGNPSAGSGTWVSLGGGNVNVVQPASGTTITQTASVTLTINSNGKVKLEMAGGTGSPRVATLPFATDLFPELNCLSVEVDPVFSMSNADTFSQTISITD